MSKISTIKNLGPACERLFALIDIHTAEEVAKLGAIESYVKLKLTAPRRVNLMFLYAIYTGLKGRHFNDLLPEEKEKLKAEANTRLEAIRAENQKNN
ncbi:MAG: TfoX/Sxy family DNA transformation protein [Candidatus Caenarcaniphilales bacterium]|nr:TfoX/Sxy family DNA transformation protein [Candidatus Caenarcaniphilales bacterium]